MYASDPFSTKSNVFRSFKKKERKEKKNGEFRERFRSRKILHGSMVWYGICGRFRSHDSKYSIVRVISLVEFSRTPRINQGLSRGGLVSTSRLCVPSLMVAFKRIKLTRNEYVWNIIFLCVCVCACVCSGIMLLA